MSNVRGRRRSKDDLVHFAFYITTTSDTLRRHHTTHTVWLHEGLRCTAAGLRDGPVHRLPECPRRWLLRHTLQERDGLLVALML